MATNSPINTANPINVSQGGTGVASTTTYAVLCGGASSTSALQSIASVGTSGQILTSNGAGALPTFQTGGPASSFWVNVSGTSQAAAVSTGYICSNASQTTVTLPATAALGSTIGIQGAGAAGWILTANSGQTIKYINTTTSTAGSLTSTSQYDNCQVVCIVANTTWAVIVGSSTGLTVT